MDVEIIKICALFSMFQIINWVFFLIRFKRANTRQRYFLIKLTTIFTFFIIGVIFLVFVHKKSFQYIANFSNTTIFLVMPLFYLFIADHNEQFSFRIMLHYIPFACLLTLVSVLMLNNWHSFMDYRTYAILFIVTFYIQYMLYLIAIYRKMGINFFTQFNKRVNSNWLQPVLTGFTLLLIFKTGIFIVWNIFRLEELCLLLCTMFLIILFIVINALILFALLRKEQLLQINKYDGIKMTPDDLESNYNLIINQLVLNKAYLNPLINLNDIAKRTGLPRNKISMIINQMTGKNFNELINAYRIEDAKILIINNNSNILDIAYEVGFNSKSTFNTAFKKYAGSTPSEFRLKNYTD